MALAEQGLIVSAYINTTARIRQSLLAALITLFTRRQSWRDADRDAFVDRAVPIAAAAQQSAALVTAAYLARMIADITGREPQQVPITLPRQVRGVDPTEVYGRPYTQIWRELADGVPFDQAVEHGRQRLESIAATDVELASTHAAHEILTGPEAAEAEVVGYRRVLTGAESCALCMLAATQRYHVADLLPIHPQCDCAIAPIIGEDDPGQIINAAVLTTGAIPDHVTDSGVRVFSGDQLLDLGDVLDSVHDVIQATFGVHDRGGRKPLDYRQVVIVHQHGELGPTLAVRGHDFTGPGDLARDTAP